MYTIAIVDDDCYIGNMLEEVLTRAGYSVIRAYSGTEALMLFEQTQPDLILLDLMLPGCSGEKVLTKIQKSSWREHLKPQPLPRQSAYGASRTPGLGHRRL